MQGNNVWSDFDLKIDIDLEESRNCTASYQISQDLGEPDHLVTRLCLDGNCFAIAQTGTTQYAANCGVWMGTLQPGQHTFKVQYRSDKPHTNNAGNNDWEERALYVMLL